MIIGAAQEWGKARGMPRHARLDSPGTLHRVMIRGIEGGKIVDGVKDRKEFIERMGTLAEETVTKI